VALAVSDVDAAAETWKRTLGIDLRETIDTESTRTRLAPMPDGLAQIAVMQALQSQHPAAEWIAQRGEGMYAIAIEVDDLNAAVRDLRAKGVPVSDPEYGPRPGTRIARIERAASSGVAVQLLQRLPEVL
jgi:catechol 2,3-dioxygenase-like lactoylglutathione lyase family enzyme